MAALPSSARHPEYRLLGPLQEGKSTEELAQVVSMSETGSGTWHFNSHCVRGKLVTWPHPKLQAYREPEKCPLAMAKQGR